MIKHKYKANYLEKKLSEAKLETERLDLELFKALSVQYALEAELLHVLLEKTLGKWYRHHGKGRIQIRELDKWIPVKFRKMSIEKPSEYSDAPEAHFSEVLSSGRVSTGYPFTIDVNDIRKGKKIRSKPNVRGIDGGAERNKED